MTARILGLLCLASFALGVAWTTDAVTLVERVDVVRQSDAWSERGTFTWPGMDEPGFLLTTTPSLPIAFEWTADDPRLDGTEATLDLRAVARVPTGSRTSWSFERPLASTSERVLDDRTIRLDAPLDLPTLLTDLEAERGRPEPAAAWRLLATVQLEGREASTFTLPLTVEPPLYLLPEASAASATLQHSTTDVVPSERRPGAAALREHPAGPIAASLGIMGLALVARRAEGSA